MHRRPDDYRWDSRVGIDWRGSARELWKAHEPARRHPGAVRQLPEVHFAADAVCSLEWRQERITELHEAQLERLRIEPHRPAHVGHDATRGRFEPDANHPAPVPPALDHRVAMIA